MNVTVSKDASGATQFSPSTITVPTSTSTVSVTMVPPSGASWTIDSVRSYPEATWTSNTAVLGVNDWDITIEASESSQSGSSSLRVTVGVKED
jgi:hypothetical protein